MTDPITGDGTDEDGSTDDGDTGSDDGDTGSDDGDTGGDCQLGGENDDADQDGFTPAQGDCNDCSPQINPGAYDFPGNEYDEDCANGVATAAEDGCDMGLAMASSDAKDAARSLGLCKFTTESDKSWGVISARFTTSTGQGNIANPDQTGLLPEFGAAEPRAGESMVALSSGTARAPGQQGYTEACDDFGEIVSCLPLLGCTGGATPPTGYPKESPGCGNGSGGGIFDTETRIANQAALEVKVRVPTNAKSLAFDSIFYTYEYPNFICSAFNDFFVVFMDPRPQGVSDDNIVFDSQGGPIGVNAGLLAVCDPGDQIPGSAKTFTCDQGTGLLQGTGFGAGEASCAQSGGTAEGAGGASTGWLHTTAPVQPGSVITLRFAVWDTGDAVLDSTVLVDKFEWSVEEPDVETVPVVM